MEAITRYSITRATEDAVILWALASAEYPEGHHLILEVATQSVINVASTFALNARRALEILPGTKKFLLRQPRWRWKPVIEGEIVTDLWDALNRIVHAKKLQVGFEQLPKDMAAVVGGARVIPYIRANTDRRELAFIDLFALAHAFLYDALPELSALAEGQPRDAISIQ